MGLSSTEIYEVMGESVEREGGGREVVGHGDFDLKRKDCDMSTGKT